MKINFIWMTLGSPKSDVKTLVPFDSRSALGTYPGIWLREEVSTTDFASRNPSRMRRSFSPQSVSMRSFPNHRKRSNIFWTGSTPLNTSKLLMYCSRTMDNRLKGNHCPLVGNGFRGSWLNFV